MKSRLSSIRNSLNSISRRKLTAIIIISFLLLSIIVSIAVYTIGKNNNQKALEEADFTIDNFDILDASETSVVIGFRLNVSNLDSEGDPTFIEGDYIKIFLINNSMTIAELDVPLDSSGFEKSKFIQTVIPIDPLNENPLIDGLINNILSGNNFYLDFKGEIHYSVGKLISDHLEFNNKLLFVVNNSALSLEINDIGISDLSTKIAKLKVQIVNPFTTGFTIKGIIHTSIDNFVLGIITLENVLRINSGSHEYSVDWTLATTPQSTFTEILKRFNSSIELITELSLDINGLSIGASPVLELSFGENLIDFNIQEVTNFNTNSADGSFEVVLTLELSSNIPMQLNITSILMDFTTLSDNDIGVLNWTNEDSISVSPYKSVLISNVSVNFSDISGSTIFEILISQAIKVPKVVLRIQFFSEEIEIIFNLDRIDL